MNLDQVEVVRLQKPEALLHRAQHTVAVTWIGFGRKKYFFSPMLGKFTESFFAEPLDPLSRVGTSGIEVRDSQTESALEQRLRFILVRHRTKPGAGAKTNDRNHFTGFAKPPLRQRIRTAGTQRYVGGFEYHESRPAF